MSANLVYVSGGISMEIYVLDSYRVHSVSSQATEEGAPRFHGGIDDVAGQPLGARGTAQQAGGQGGKLRRASHPPSTTAEASATGPTGKVGRAEVDVVG